MRFDQHTGRSERWRVRRAALTLMLLALAGCAAAGPSAAATTHTPPPAPTATLPPLQPPGTGWQTVSSAGGTTQHIAFAPSAPETAYACANTASGAATNASAGPDSPAGPIVVSVSHDSGRTWQRAPTPATDQQCALSVDPVNALDLVLITESCVGTGDTCQTGPLNVYRSHDGGQTWAAMAAPAYDHFDQDGLLAWVGSTLFIATGSVAMSRDGAPFETVGQSVFGTGATANARILGLFALSQRLYVEINVCNPAYNPARCDSQYAVTDGAGASWTLQSLAYRGQTVLLQAAGADGQSLYGALEQTAPPPPPQAPPPPVLVRSVNGGVTWKELPAYPQVAPALLCCAGTRVYLYSQLAPGSFAAPDGTLYVLLVLYGGSGGGAIVKLAPGATGWDYAGAPPSGNLLALAWDSGGHPVALWGTVGTQLATLAP